MVVLDLEGNAISDQEKSAEKVTLFQNSSKESRRIDEAFRENESKDYDPGTVIRCQVSYQLDSPTGCLDFQWEKLSLIDIIEKKIGNNHKGFDDADENLDGQISDRLSRSSSLERPQRILTQKPLLHDGCLCQSRATEDKFLTRQDKVIVNNPKEITPTSVVHMSNQDDRKYISRDGSIDSFNLKDGQGRFPENGCLSQKNIANGKSNNSARDTVGEIVLNKHPNGSQVQIGVASPDSKDDWAVRRKGKSAINEDAAQLACGTNLKTQFRSNREFLESGKVNISSCNKDTLRSSTDITQRTRNESVGKSIKSCSDNACSSKRVEWYDLSEESPKIASKIASGFGENIHYVHDSPGIVSCLEGSKSNSYGVNSKLETKTGLHNSLQEQVKRECKSVNSSSAEYSVVAKNHQEDSHIETFRQASISKLDGTPNSKWNSSVSGSSILVEEQNSQTESSSCSREEGCTEYDTFKEAGDQIEMDEILARQLQEEFYHELPTYGGIEEVDENLAWSLQREEEAHKSSIARKMRYNSRDASMAHLYAHGRHSPFQNSYQQATYPARVQLANRRRQQRRNSNNSASNVEMSFLESLESAFDSSNDIAVSNNLLPIHRDFTEDDYEMLLSLDENNFQRTGASENQINSLPLSIHKQSGDEVACAVCLEIPSAGDIFRHLPCLHKFHKDCIDTWLRRKAVCPVCKSGIS